MYVKLSCVCFGFFLAYSSDTYWYRLGSKRVLPLLLSYPFRTLLRRLCSRSVQKSIAKMSSRVQSRVHEGRRFQDTAAHRRDTIRRDAMRYSATRCARCDTFLVAPPWSATKLQELALRAPVINNSLPGNIQLLRRV